MCYTVLVGMFSGTVVMCYSVPVGMFSGTVVMCYTVPVGMFSGTVVMCYSVPVGMFQIRRVAVKVLIFQFLEVGMGLCLVSGL
jgi:hypothetical protein